MVFLIIDLYHIFVQKKMHTILLSLEPMVNFFLRIYFKRSCYVTYTI